MRLLRNLFLGLCLLLMLVVGALVVWREYALETAGRMTLSRLGLEQASLRVTEVSLNRIVAEGIALGPGLPTLARADLRFQPLRLLQGELQEVWLSGLRITVEEKGQNLFEKLGFLTKVGGEKTDAGSGGGKGSGSSLKPPLIMLEDAEILLRATPAGDGLIAFSGELRSSAAGLAAKIAATLDIGHTLASLTARTELRDGQNVIILDGSGKTDATELLAQGPLAEQAASMVRKGKANYTLAGEVSAPSKSPVDPRAWLQMPFGLEGKMNLDEVQSVFAPETVSGEVTWRMVGDGRSVTAGLPQPASLLVSGMPVERLANTGLDLPLDQPVQVEIQRAAGKLGLVDGKVSGDWTADGGAQVQIADSLLNLTADMAGNAGSPDIQLRRLQAEAFGLPIRLRDNSGLLKSLNAEISGSVTAAQTFDLSGQLELEAVDLASEKGVASRLLVKTPIAITGDAGNPRLIADGLQATVEGAQALGMITFAGPLTANASTARFVDGAATGRVSVEPGAGQIAADKGAKPIRFTWKEMLADVSVTGMDSEAGSSIEGTLNLAVASATITDANIQIDGASATLPLASGPVTLAMQIVDRQRQKRFTPVSLSLSGEKTDDAVTLSGMATLHRGRARIPLRLTAGLEDQKIRANYGPANLRFEKGVLQPKDLAPSMRVIRQAIGLVTVSGAAAVDKGRIPNLSATVVIDDLSVQTDGVQAEGVDGKLKFASLQPLATAGAQSLTVRRVTAGVPVNDVFATFSIPRTRRGLTVKLLAAGGGVAGGKITVGPAVYQGGAADLQVGIAALPLEQLLREWKIEGVGGTGLITGTIPMSIRPAGVAIGDGRLRSLEPGVLQVDFGSARHILTNAGKQVDLAVRTLEDFHYKKLSLGVTKPEGGELSLAIGLDGNNPAVLDGHPFRFNINLSGRLEPILEAIQAGDRISADLLRGSLGQ